MDNNIKANGGEDKILLTLEEWLRLADSQAVFSGFATSPAHFSCGNDEVDKMCGLIEGCVNLVDEEILWYVSLCFAKGSENAPCLLASLEMLQEEEGNLYQPLWGFKANDAMVLLGLMLLNHVKGQMKGHCTRMTLGQYLDALVGISGQKDGTLDRKRTGSLQTYKDMLLVDYDDSRPLDEVLTDILRHYIAAWQEFDHLDHILNCMEELSSNLECEALPSGTDRAEIVGECMDSKEHYFNLACEYQARSLDTRSRDIAEEALYDGFFLPERDYSPETLRGLAAKAPSLEMRALLEEHICEDRLASAMREINKAVTDLYILFVNPYLQMRGDIMKNI